MEEQRLFVLRRCKTHERSSTTLLRSCPPASRVYSRPTQSRPLLAAPSVGPVRGPLFHASFQCADFGNIRRFTSTSALSWATEAWRTPLPITVATQILSAQFRVNFRRATVPGQLQAEHAHELFAICESSGCSGLEWSRLNSTGHYLCQEPLPHFPYHGRRRAC